ncbi:Hypothetical protein CINCED_3A005674 [Cinara cedri]|uniref:Uncharacterized protein n=1 Tax=Cinara cedri TaxID=506608 RepID=A0A5E4MW85_9HEMI|nr:Hypothetical protein CINCED_3A005674 [Cinara cedri]
MVKVPSSYDYTPTISGLTSVQYKDLGCDRDEMRKASVRQQSEDRQRRLAEILALNEKRIADLVIRRKADKLRTQQKGNEHNVHVQLRLEKIRAFDLNRKLRLIEACKLRDKKVIRQIVDSKRAKITMKWETDIKRYRELFAKQKSIIENNKSCLLTQSLPPKIPEPKKVEIEEEEPVDTQSSESCSYTKYNANRIHENAHTITTDGSVFTQSDQQALNYESHRSFKTKILDRIEKLKTNFATCKQGEMFWNKTAPLWNRMTQCLEEETLLEESVEWAPREYRGNESEVMMVNATDVQGPTLMQQIMLNNVNYGPTDNNDNMIIEAMKKAKILSEPTATANDVISLARKIVEHEADIRINVEYIMHGLVERGIFEYTKKRISKTIYADARKTIDRLRHVNDNGVIPKKLIKSKNKLEVATVVNDLINNDHLYSRFDRSLDGNVVPETGVDRMRAFLATLSNEIFPMKLYQMDGRRKLFEDIQDLVAVFLVIAHQKTAYFVSTTKPDDLKFAGSSPVTICMVYRICRKLAKYVLGKFRTDERKTHNFWATVNAYKALLSKRSPCVVYDRRVFKPPEKIDMKYYRTLYNDMNPRKKKIVPHSSFIKSSG